MICHSIEYLLWWTDERDEGIEQVTQQKTGSMPASPATYTYKYIHMFVFQMEPKGGREIDPSCFEIPTCASCSG